VSATIGALTESEVASRCDHGGIPFAGVATSKSLLTDHHLVQSGALLDIVMRNGAHAGLPSLPVKLGGRRLGVRLQPPKVGQHTREILTECGIDEAQINALERAGVIVAP
jgi:crotonobetainyl-CoA:carnitine CoA-transferase CaiB-like acyl-CoA transferase